MPKMQIYTWYSVRRAGRIYKVFIAKNNSVLRVTVPTMGKYTLKSFAMKPGTLCPLTPKIRLGKKEGNI